MDFYFGLACASLLSLANAQTSTSLTPTAYPLYPNFDNCGFNLNATCDDHMELFADGNLLATSDDWRRTSVVYIPPNTGEIKIRCTDRWILGGILASSDNGLMTNNAWNCSSGNGAPWQRAHELGPNGVTAKDISPLAKWIWTDRPTWRHTEWMDQTTATCTIQLPNNSECPPTSTPNCTDLFNGTTPTPISTPKPVSGFNLNATCNNKMELFVDGNLRATSYNWRDTSPVHIPENSQTIEIHCSDSCWLIEGILASSDNGLRTDNSWTCSSDNGITWSSAHEIVPNGLSVPDISPNAKWISTVPNTWRMDGGKVICKVDLDLPISTTTTSEGCVYTDKYVECPEFKDQCNSEEFSDCMMTDCTKTCKCTSTTNIKKKGCSVGDEFEGNCYLLVETPKTWLDAQVYCNGRNGNLTSIDNIEANNFLANLAGGSRAWIGASDAETEGLWKWTNGDNVLFSNWYPGEPNNGHGKQHCGVINYDDTGKWDDDGCDEKLHPFICQGNQLSNVTEDCSCSDFKSKYGGGQCKTISKILKGAVWCYVNKPSSCTDIIASKYYPGEGYSAEACKDVTGGTCDTSNWPDVDNGVICGNCKALIDKMNTKYITCNNYCKSIGQSCSGAWEESNDDCNIKSEHTCTHRFDYTSDAICECDSAGSVINCKTTIKKKSARSEKLCRDICNKDKNCKYYKYYKYYKYSLKIGKKKKQPTGCYCRCCRDH